MWPDHRNLILTRRISRLHALALVYDFFLHQSAFDQCAVLNRTNDCASALSFSVRSLFRSVQSDLDK